MTPKHIDFHCAYEFAATTVDVVKDPASNGFPGDVLSDFFGFRTDKYFIKSARPNKVTLLHDFILEVNYFPLGHYCGKIGYESIIPTYAPIIDSANIRRPKWFIEGVVQDHIPQLRELLWKASHKITDAAFQLLFADRTFLYEFNKLLASYSRQLTRHESLHLADDGRFQRCSYLPTWLTNAVFHRDKGRCQLCGEDLTNLLVPTTARHYDHMIPLKNGGNNDPTNFQLSCERCNTTKGAKDIVRPHLTHTFW